MRYEHCASRDQPESFPHLQVIDCVGVCRQLSRRLCNPPFHSDLYKIETSSPQNHIHSLPNMAVGNLQQQSGKVLSPSALAHVVFLTADLPRMVNFWTTFLGGQVSFASPVIAFLSYDDEHHRIAIIKGPNVAPKNPAGAGMHHVAFTFKTLSDLMTSYHQRKAHGILPTRCINHGPTTSMYYEDPDGNAIETQVDNFDTAEEATAFMTGPLFAENPIGTEFDPQDLEDKLNAGVDEKIIKKRIEIGPRGLPSEYTEKQ